MTARSGFLTATVMCSWVVSAFAQTPAPMVDGVPVIHWREARQYYDREVIVHGQVVMTRNIGFYAFVNFDREFRQHFSIVVRQESFNAFPQAPEMMYRDKYVAVRGKVIQYREKPEIVVVSPRQIVVFEQPPADILAALKAHTPVGPEALAAQPETSTAARGKWTVAEVNLTGLDLQRNAWCASPDESTTTAEGLAHAAVMIRGLDADVVAMQWSGPAKCLQRFHQRIVSDLGYAHLVFHSGKDGTADCAILSRYPVIDSRIIPDYESGSGQRTAFQRPPLQADVQLPGGDVVTLLVINMKKTGEGFTAAHRAAEASGLRSIIDQLGQRRPEVGMLISGGFAGSLEDRHVAIIRGAQPGSLVVPGYTPPAEPDDKPLIAMVTNLILVTDGQGNRYVPASTRVRPHQELQNAVAVSFYLEKPTPEPTPTPSPAPPPPTGDDF